MTRLTLDLALRVIAGAFAKGTELKCVPLTVVVLDAGGHEVAAQRQDRSGILRVDIARAKAWGALGMGYSSREIGERAQKAPGFFGALAAVRHGRRDRSGIEGLAAYSNRSSLAAVFPAIRSRSAAVSASSRSMSPSGSV